MEDQLNQNLVKLWSFFKWLDNARWNWEKEKRTWIGQLLNYVNDVLDKPIKDFEPKHLVLTHWLTYIFDYQVRVEDVWRKCFPIMFCIVKDFQEGCSVEEIIGRYKKQEIAKNGKTTVYFSVGDKTKFRHRFTTAKQHKLVEKVERTLRILDGYFNRDLIEFMIRISSYGEENDWIRRVACALYLLTYANEKEKKAIDTLISKEKFENYFKRKNDLWHKRLWAALRDYLKSSIHEYIKKSLENYGQFDSKTLNRWRNPQEYLNQLEVPGDIWNKEFYNNVIEPLIEKFGLSKELGLKRSWPLSKKIRVFYEHFKEYDYFKKHGFYPEQFDVTFDFARLFCQRNLCYICPLYKKGGGNVVIEKLCVGDLVSESEKYCPILAILGYMQQCSPNNCPVYREDVPRICEGLTWNEQNGLG